MLGWDNTNQLNHVQTKNSKYSDITGKVGANLSSGNIPSNKVILPQNMNYQPSQVVGQREVTKPINNQAKYSPYEQRDQRDYRLVEC